MLDCVWLFDGHHLRLQREESKIPTDPSRSVPREFEYCLRCAGILPWFRMNYLEIYSRAYTDAIQISVAIEYYPPLYFQAVKGASPLRSGLLVLPILLTDSCAAFSAGVIIHRTGRYLTLIRIGPVIMTAGVGLYILFSRTSSIGQIIGVQILTGIGCGLLFEPPILALQAWVPQERVATASSTYGLMRSISYVMSIVIGGVIFQNSMATQVDKLIAPPVSLPSNITDLLLNGHAAANVIAVNLIQDPAQKMAVQEAFAWSLRNMWIFMVCISSLCIVATIFIKKKVLTTEHVETKTGIAADKS